MKRIKQLSDNLINQIAAGEVIERPSSVVKELIENSVDAGAKKIEIEISNDCKNIRVADNGNGIHKDDIIMAFSRHATSKISEQEDLWNISTLGFRGEALASIISIAKVICTTKTEESENGTKVECENSNVKTTEVGCAKGTIMEVKNLFYNTPVRLKFLKRPQTEYSNIIETVQNIAISHPEVAFVLINKGYTSLRTSGTSEVETAISEVYSNDLIKDLAKIDKQDALSNLSATGFTSNPDFTRSNKKAIYLFVNGRTVKCPVMLKAIDNAYKDLIPSGRHPFTVINLSLPTDEVDVNAHPTKKDVRFTNPNQIYGFIYGSIKSALEISISKKPEVLSAQMIKEEGSMERTSTQSVSFVSHNDKQDHFVDFKRIQTNIQNANEFYKPIEKQINIELDASEQEETVDKPKIIGQLFNTYILIEHNKGLQVIDQHIAHERYLYEKLQNAEDFASQLIFTSEAIELESTDIDLIQNNKELLQKYGYIIETANDSGVMFKQVPQIIAKKNPEQTINDLLDALKGSLDSIENEIIKTTACKAAVKAGEKLSIWQMEELIINWQKTKYPKTCPHGRVISHIIPSKDIAAFFGRPDVNV